MPPADSISEAARAKDEDPYLWHAGTSNAFATAGSGGRMSSDLRISYHPRLDATPEAELEVLAAVYWFLIQGWENRKAASSGCADNKGGDNNQPKAPSGSGSPSATDRREE